MRTTRARKSVKTTGPRQKYVAIATKVNQLGEPYRPGQCAVAEYLAHEYPELKRIFVDEDGRISFTDSLSGNRYRWKIEDKDFRMWLVGFDRGQAPDWDVEIFLDTRDAKVTSYKERRMRSEQALAYEAQRLSEGRPQRRGAQHGKRLQRRPTVTVESR